MQAISAGVYLTCALVNGGAQCWGINGLGQLGNNASVSGISTVPVPVVGLTSGVQAVAAGEETACALANGGVWCWGYNQFGSLGNNAEEGVYPLPVRVVGLTSGVQAIATGQDIGCALTNGGLQCWGINGEGQLGNNSTANAWTPGPVSGLSTGVQSITTGSGLTCAVVNGTAQCWGGLELGNGSTNQSNIPVQVTGLSSGVQTISTGFDNHTCAIVNGGAVCWGYNEAGQIGNNSTTTALVPSGVEGLSTGTQAIAAGNETSCAIVNGAVRCWGRNAMGQLGNGSTSDSWTPVISGPWAP